jgi:hypothetical protein
MDQISIKTPNPKCRLYWCLIEFVDWRYSRSCWYFRTSFVNCSPSNLLTGSSTPSPPLPCVNKYRGTCVHTVCNGGGGGLGSDALDRLTPAAKYLYWSIFKKSRHLRLGVFIDIWSMSVMLARRMSIERNQPSFPSASIDK